MCVMFQSKINVMLYDAANPANNGYPGPLTILRSAQRERREKYCRDLLRDANLYYILH